MYFHSDHVFSIESSAHEGYTFDGMSVNGGILKINNNTYKVLADRVYVTINAHINKYTVRFINEGQPYYTNTFEFGSKIPNIPENPVKAADSRHVYTFTHWAIKDGENYIAVNLSEYTISKDVVFYAIYEKSDVVYTVNLDIENIITSFILNVWRDEQLIETITTNTSFNIYYDDLIEISYESPEGYNANVYGDGMRFENEKYRADGTTLSPTIRITSQIITCEVSFYNEDGTKILKTSNVNYGNEIEPPTNPYKLSTNIYNYIFSH